MKIRIDSPTGTGLGTHVYLQHEPKPDDWFAPIETEISHCITALDFHTDIQGVSTATLNVLLVNGSLHADVDKIVLEHLWGSQWPRLRHHWWRIRRPKTTTRRVGDTSTLADRWRRWVAL